MIKKCSICDCRIKEIVTECPCCGNKFICSACGDELNDNKYDLCPTCKGDKSIGLKKWGKRILKGVVFVGTAVVLAMVKGKDKDNNDLSKSDHKD